MLKILANYIIPSLRHIFIVIPSYPIENNNPCLLLHSKTRKLYFERAVLSKDMTYREQNAIFTIKVIAEDDFLESIAEIGSMTFSQNRAFETPGELELLSMNLIKDTASSEDTSFASRKLLSTILDEDIIEVFI